MALSKANKAIFKAKYGEQLYEAMIAAENVIVTDGGVEKSLADVLLTLATGADLETVSGKVTALVGSDTDKSARVIAGEVLAAAGKLERKKATGVEDIDPAAGDADKYIYMVPKSGAKSGDKYDEYMVIDGAVEKVGDWEVDLADYLTKVTGATAGDVAVFKADGTIEDANIKASDITAAKTVTDKISANADVLKDISSADVTKWNGAGHIYASAAQPENLKSGDLWLQTFEE